MTNLLLMSAAGDSFIRLFAEMSPLVIVLFVIGILLCIIELFIPGFGAFGISGCISIFIAIILRMVNGGDAYMLVYMLVIAILIVGGIFFVVARSLKKGALSKAKMFDVGTAVPTGITEGTKDFSSLVGKKGVAMTLLHPIGLADFDGDVEDVIAKIGVIDQGATVVVTHVEGQKIIVEEIK